MRKKVHPNYQPKLSKRKKLELDDALEKLGDLPKFRFDYSVNHQLIIQAMLDFMSKKGYPATQRQLSEATGLSEVTIGKHCKEIKLSNFCELFRTLTPRIITGLAAKAMKGTAPEVKLWMQLTEDWKESTKSEHTGKDGAPLFDGLEKLTDEELEQEHQKLLCLSTETNE